MAISRPLLLALLGVVLLGATVLAVQNARDESTGPTAPAAQRAPEAAPAQPAPAPSPEETLRSAFDFNGIDSAAFAADLSGSADRQEFSVELTGAFEQGAPNDLPLVRLDAKIAAPGERARGGFTSLGDKAYFTRGDTGWQVPEEVWTPLVEAAAKGGATQPQERLAAGIDPGKWLREVESRGTETVGGVETTHVAATVDPKKVFNDLLAVARRNGAPVPDAGPVARSVKRAEVEAWVGTDDRLMRRVRAEVAFAGQGRLALEIELTGVNQPQDVEAPANVRQGLPGGSFGELVQGFSSGLTRLGGGQPVSVAALSSRNPRRAARAVQANKKVLIFFRNPDGLDDRLMSRVVREVDRRTKAVVLTDHVDAVDRYGSMVEDLGVSQTPSVVLLDRAGDARLIEGYVDTDTLAQAVADAR